MRTMALQLPIGIEMEQLYVVSEKDLATVIGSGDVDVLATPAMIAMIENVAKSLVEDKLPAGYTTVGIRIDVRHINPVPLGAKITVKVRLEKQEDKKLIFKAEVFWRELKIGEGTHERYVVKKDRFMDKVKKLALR